MLGALIFRDIVQYVFPTIIAITLFLPFFGAHTVSVEGLVFGAILLGYVFSSLIGKLVGISYDYIPIIRKCIRKRQRIAEWMDSNWDYATVFYSLTHEDREYLYLTAAYKDFYYVTSFYLLAYSLLNAVLLVVSVCGASQPSTMVFGTYTPILGERQIPTVAAMLLSFAGFVFLFKDHLIEYQILFYPDGQHDHFARQCYKKNPGIARSLWGKVTDNGQAGAAVEVILQDSDGKVIGRVTTDELGLFHFKHSFDRCIRGGCRLQLKQVGQDDLIPFQAQFGNFPYLAIELTRSGSPNKENARPSSD
jgi:hypothetical protein